MAEAGIQVQLSVAEIYAVLCKKCRAKLRELVKDKISEQMVDQIIGVDTG